ELLQKTIRPEFLNRIDEVIMFAPLSREELGKIVHMQFANVQSQLAEMGIHLTASDEALDWLAQLGYDPQYGARPLNVSSRSTSSTSCPRKSSREKSTKKATLSWICLITSLCF